MPAIGKQRRANRNRVFRTRRDRFAVNSKPKSYAPLAGKLKNNNNLLAKALSAQKQETQSLFTEKIELTSQLQALTLACNKRDLVLANVQKNAKEMLTMLVTMTNFVTNTIMGCQEFCRKPDSNTLRPSCGSALRRDSNRRLSTKSPARGVVKPMVSGHTITKPTINLRRVNMQRINNLMDLSIIDEASSPEQVNGTTLNNSLSHAAAFTTSNRLGYEGERRRRLPERIPVGYVQADDDEGDTRAREESRLSARFSGRVSNSLARKRSGSMPMGLMRSPSVSLCDVSKLLQNSQTINVRMLQDSQANRDSGTPSSTEGENISPRVSNGNLSSVSIATRESEAAQKSQKKTVQFSPTSTRKVSQKKNTKTVRKSNNNSEVDPLEGPSWLLNETVDSAEETTVEIFRRKHHVRKIDSSESECDRGENSDDNSMEFTECVNAVRRAPKILTSEIVVNKQNDVSSNIPNHILEDQIIVNNDSSARDFDDLPDHTEYSDEQCATHAMNRSSEFVTDRRQRYAEPDDEDDDTIMLQMSRGVTTSRFDINDFRLPVVNCQIIAPTENNDSEPEVTTTIQRIPQNYVAANLLHDNIEDRVSHVASPQLPKIDDELPKTNKKRGRPTAKSRQKKRGGKSDEYDSSDSDFSFEPKKKPTKAAQSTNVKDPSSAKVVLQKLNDTHIKTRSITPDQSLGDKIQDLDGTNQRMLETGNSELVTDSNSSTHSAGETSRPRRQKAPTNLKEPNLSKTLRV